MVIGLTGGIASGKTTVSNMLKEIGAIIIDADVIAREVVQPGETTWHQIRVAFGESVFLSTGEIDRQKLGQIIFHEPEERSRLNAIIHPAIRKRMKEKKEQAQLRGESLIVMDIPLLFESELEHMVDQILVVYVPEEVQKSRLMNRDNIDEELAMAKMSSQISIEEKKDKGHAYIDNSKTLQETRQQLIKILQNWGHNV